MRWFTYGVRRSYVCLCVSVCLVKLHASCKVPAAVLLSSPAVKSDRQRLRFTENPLVFRGLISKLLEVGFDLALKALIALFPLVSVRAAFLPISEWRDQILHGTDELDLFHCFYSLFPLLCLSPATYPNTRLRDSKTLQTFFSWSSALPGLLCVACIWHCRILWSCNS